MADQARLRVKRVPTRKDAPASAAVDVPRDGPSLRALARDDPFLFHSIPSVKRAKLSLEELDYASLASSLPGGVQGQEGPAAARVARKTRVSTEGHSSLLLAALLREEEFARPLREEGGADLIDLLGGGDAEETTSR